MPNIRAFFGWPKKHMLRLRETMNFGNNMLFDPQLAARSSNWGRWLVSMESSGHSPPADVKGHKLLKSPWPWDVGPMTFLWLDTGHHGL